MANEGPAADGAILKNKPAVPRCGQWPVQHGTIRREQGTDLPRNKKWRGLGLELTLSKDLET